MKKVLCTSLILLLIVSGITVAFAAESANTTVAATNTATTTSSAIDTTGAAVDTTGAAVETTGAAVTIVPDMTFTGTPINLSLEDAYKKMLTDSPGAQMAELNRQSADGVSKGYGESVSLINKSESKGGDYNTTDKKILQIQRTYAATQGPRNYESEINELKSQTLENYYKLKELENQMQIATDNLALKEKLLSNTQLKFKLGTVSKSDVLQAEISVQEAKDGFLAAENGLNTMKMGFNQFMGYDLMQNVTLTDTIKEVALPEQSLVNSIKDALVNRNEIYEADYNVKVSTLNLNNYKSYPKSSSKYITAKMSLLMAETGKKNAPLDVEKDVRSKYMTMTQKHAAVQTGKKSAENAKEAERLAQLQYDAGMATLSDVEEAQLGYYNAQLSFSKTLLEYNLAVDAYELASGVGTTTAKI